MSDVKKTLWRSVEKFKLKLWTACVENNDLDCFSTVNDFLLESDSVLDESIRKEVADHIRDLDTNLAKYFPPVNNDNDWVRNPFKITEKPAKFSASDYENLIEMTSDSQLKQNFSELSLVGFWNSISKEYPNLGRRAIRVLLPFATTYLYAKLDFHITLQQKQSTEID